MSQAAVANQDWDGTMDKWCHLCDSMTRHNVLVSSYYYIMECQECGAESREEFLES